MRGEDLEEHPDLLGIRILELIPGLVERLRVVGVKLHWACLPVEFSCGIAAVRLGWIREELGEAPIDLSMRFHSI